MGSCQRICFDSSCPGPSLLVLREVSFCPVVQRIIIPCTFPRNNSLSSLNQVDTVNCLRPRESRRRRFNVLGRIVCIKIKLLFCKQSLHYKDKHAILQSRKETNSTAAKQRTSSTDSKV